MNPEQGYWSLTCFQHCRKHLWFGNQCSWRCIWTPGKVSMPVMSILDMRTIRRFGLTPVWRVRTRCKSCPEWFPRWCLRSWWLYTGQFSSETKLICSTGPLLWTLIVYLATIFPTRLAAFGPLGDSPFQDLSLWFLCLLFNFIISSLLCQVSITRMPLPVHVRHCSLKWIQQSLTLTGLLILEFSMLLVPELVQPRWRLDLQVRMTFLRQLKLVVWVLPHQWYDC